MRSGVNTQFVDSLLIMQSKADGVINRGEKLFYDRTDFGMVLSRFIKFKEMFVKKVYRSDKEDDYELILDLESSKKILWDLLFLSEVVKFETERQNGPAGSVGLRNAITLKRYNDTVPNGDEHVYIDDYQSLFDLEDDVVLIDGTILKQRDLFDAIADALCIFDALRNCAGHNKDGNSVLFDFTPITRDVTIINNNPKNLLNLKIDYDYLADFGYGIRIKPEHAFLAEKVNYYEVALSDVLDISLLDGMDIFYRVEPSVLSSLLEFVDNDYKKLLSLPVALFYQKVNYNKLNELLDIVGDVTLFKFVPISYFSNRCSKSSLDFLKDYLNYATTNNISIKDALKQLKDNVKTNFFLKGDNIFEIIKYLNGLPEVAGYKFSIFDLPNYPSTFTSTGNSLAKVKFLLNLCDNRVYELKKINRAVFYSSCSVKRLKLLLKGCNNFSVLDGLSSKIFHHDCLISKLELLLLDSGDGKEKIDRFKYIKKLPDCVFDSECSENKLMFILTKGGLLKQPDLSLIDEFPEYVFYKTTSSKRIKQLVGEEWDLSRLKGVPQAAYSSTCFTSTIDYYLENNIDLSLLPAGMFLDIINYDNLMYIFNVDILNKKEFLQFITKDKTNNDILNKLPFSVFQTGVKKERIKLLMGVERDVSNLYGLDEIFFTNDFDERKISLLIEYGYNDKFNDIKYAKLWDKIYFPIFSVDRLKYLLANVESIDELNSLSRNVFSYMMSDCFLQSLVSLVGISNLKYISSYALTDIERLDYSNNIAKPIYSESRKHNTLNKLSLILGKTQNFDCLRELPDYYFSLDCSYDRFNNLYERTGYNLELLKLLPKELFTCDKEYLDSVFYTNYDKQIFMLKSLFGVDSEAVISLVLLMSGVFNGYERNDTLSNSVDTSFINMVDEFAGFSALSPSELIAVKQEITELLTDDKKFINYLKINGLSFDTFCDEFKNFKGKSGNNRITVDQLAAAFTNWSAAYEKIFSEKIPLVNGNIIRCSRNGIGHFKFEFIPSNSGKVKEHRLGIYDSILTKDVSSGISVKPSFGGSATIEKWYEFTSNILKVNYLGIATPLSLEKNIKCVSNSILDGVDYKSVEDLSNALLSKINAYREKVISFCIASSYLLENEPTKLVSVAKGTLDIFIQDTGCKPVSQSVSVALNYLKSIGMTDEYVDNLVSSRNFR